MLNGSPHRISSLSSPVLSFLFLLLAVPVLAHPHEQITPPLHTSGHEILDAANHPVRLASVNWYGIDQKEFVPGGLDHATLAQIVGQLQALGLNSVRLPWANETFEKNPLVPDYAVKANPQFRGKRALDVMDAVISALAGAHVMIILDNHVSRADWCCKDNDGNALWYTTDYPEEKWLADWRAVVLRYKNQPWVVGADLRNELRGGAQWGGSDAQLDWHAAAERGGNAVLDANPNLLVMVEGPQYSTDFTAFAALPLVLKVPGRLVYSPHAYSSPAHTFSSYVELKQVLDSRAGFLLHSEPAVPLWVGEFGTCQSLDCGANSQWFTWFVQYLKENHLSWGYWPLNGTQSSGYSRTYDSLETYGLLTPDYQHIAATKVLELLRAIQPTN
jgi:endoglucanase